MTNTEYSSARRERIASVIDFGGNLRNRDLIAKVSPEDRAKIGLTTASLEHYLDVECHVASTIAKLNNEAEKLWGFHNDDLKVESIYETHVRGVPTPLLAVLLRGDGSMTVNGPQAIASISTQSGGDTRVVDGSNTNTSRRTRKSETTKRRRGRIIWSV